VYDRKDWRTVNRHLLACVKDKYSFDARVVRDTLHHLSIQNQLLQMENDRLQEALNQQKKGRKEAELYLWFSGNPGMVRLNGGLLHE
jgi:regulator of replication initiation timing